MTEAAKVRVQSAVSRRDGRTRWAYVIEDLGLFVSAYRYGSRASAQQAGERDAAQAVAYRAVLDTAEGE